MNTEQQPQPSPPKPAPSAVHTWLRIFLWLTPGVATSGYLILILQAYLSTIHSGSGLSDENLLWLAFLAWVIVTLGAAVFDSILQISAHEGRGNLTAGAVLVRLLVFGVIQIFVVPFIVGLTWVGCILVTG